MTVSQESKKFLDRPFLYNEISKENNFTNSKLTNITVCAGSTSCGDITEVMQGLIGMHNRTWKGWYSLRIYVSNTYIWVEVGNMHAYVE